MIHKRLRTTLKTTDEEYISQLREGTLTSQTLSFKGIGGTFKRERNQLWFIQG